MITKFKILLLICFFLFPLSCKQQDIYVKINFKDSAQMGEIQKSGAIIYEEYIDKQKNQSGYIYARTTEEQYKKMKLQKFQVNKIQKPINVPVSYRIHFKLN
jgi:hypothetical protein